MANLSAQRKWFCSRFWRWFCKRCLLVSTTFPPTRKTGYANKKCGSYTRYFVKFDTIHVKATILSGLITVNSKTLEEYF